MIRRAIRTYLLANAPLMALLERGGKKHVYLSRVPKSNPPLANFPCVVYRRVNGNHEHDLDGSAGHASPQFDFFVTAINPDDVEAIAEQLRLALQGFQGLMNGIRVDCCTLDDEADDYIESKIGDDVGFHVTQCTYTIAHHEAIPDFS